MKDFRSLWKFATRHGSIVQEPSELEHVFNLAKECNSYLEIGTAEGNSLYVIAHALQRSPAPKITYVDWNEPHTYQQRQEALEEIYNDIYARTGFAVGAVHGNSHHSKTINDVYSRFDMVMIDAGHEYEDAIADAIAYGRLAKKYIVFHDIQLEPVRKAFEWYCKVQEFRDVTTFISRHDSPYGYGIVKL